MNHPKFWRLHGGAARATPQALRHFPRKGELDRIPPPELQIQVLGKAGSDSSFLYGGYIVSEGIRDALRAIGRPVETFQSILELGCGCSRVLRWFDDLAGRLHGTDISAEAICWSKANIPYARFAVNAPQPPLFSADHSFDLVYAISVVTHLDEQLQFAWLEELRRLVRPGGIVMLSVNGDEVAAWHMPEAERARYREHGHQYHRVQAGGLHGLPEFYQDAYHSRDYIEREWTKYFRLRAYIRYGPVYLQDLVILEKAPAGGPCLSLDLPVCGIKTPVNGDVVSGETMEVQGTCFRPCGDRPPVDIWIDDSRVATCLPRNPSPTVFGAYPHWGATEACAFAATIPLAPLTPGWHNLKLAPDTSLVASGSAYFFVE